jgi:glycosyltransferase involved in cell wall biosynthesis
MRVSYVSACFDASGYAMAARNNIMALHTAGVDLAVVPISFEQKKTDLGKLGNLCRSLVAPDTGCKIKIIHATPPNFPRLVKPGCYNIGYVAWETDRLPDDWVDKINLLDEVWVPSTYNVDAFKRSGVEPRVLCYPHPMGPPTEKELSGAPGVVKNIDGDNFVFYSIFQWLERKNPVGLLKAYLTEFGAEEDVCLVMKTFRINPGLRQDTDLIKQDVQSIKRHLFLPSYPKVLLISSLLTASEMCSLHQRGDCFVSLNRCEGFGIPIAEAMQFGKPVIATGYGGPVDFLDQFTGYPVNYMLTPVSGMPWDMYKGNMNWAEPDLIHARTLMRKVFRDREEAKKKGQAAKVWVEEHLSWEAIGKVMAGRLKQIELQL